MARYVRIREPTVFVQLRVAINPLLKSMFVVTKIVHFIDSTDFILPSEQLLEFFFFLFLSINYIQNQHNNGQLTLEGGIRSLNIQTSRKQTVFQQSCCIFICSFTFTTFNQPILFASYKILNYQIIFYPIDMNKKRPKKQCIMLSYIESKLSETMDL